MFGVELPQRLEILDMAFSPRLLVVAERLQYHYFRRFAAGF